MGYEGEFFIKYNPKKFRFSNNWYLRSIYVERWIVVYFPLLTDDEFRFNDASTHEGHLRQNGELTWFCSETIIMISHKCIKCKTRTNLKIKAVILC